MKSSRVSGRTHVHGHLWRWQRTTEASTWASPRSRRPMSTDSPGATASVFLNNVAMSP